MGFKKDDKVRVVARNHSLHGEIGTVVFTYSTGDTFLVRFPSGRESGFFLVELEAVADPEREALILLAETLDRARLQANAIEATAPQRGVYGQIQLSLHDTIELIFVDLFDSGLLADRVYGSLVEDGNTVREAIAYVEKNYVNKEEV